MLTQEINSTTLVDKELIGNLSFKTHMPFDQDPNLMNKLVSATAAGNLDKTKFQIDFYSDEGPMSVRTTIWATGNKFICLKGGLWIPISKIINIRNI